MKITITAKGGSPVVLADHGKESVNGLTCEVTREVEVQTFLRSASAKPVERGNELLKYSFSTVREHASLTDAQAYWFDRSAIVPRSGEVVFEFEDGETRRTLPDAVLTYNLPNPTGALTRETVTIWSGKAFVQKLLRDSSGIPLYDSTGAPLFSVEEI